MIKVDFKEIKNKVNNFILDIKKRPIFYMSIIILILLIIITFQCNRNSFISNENDIYKQNIDALSSENVILSNKAGELYTERTAFAATANELAIYNEELANELSKYRGKVAHISNINTSIISKDTVILRNYDTTFVLSNKENKHIVDWVLSENTEYGLTLRGRTQFRTKNDSLYNVSSQLQNYEIKLKLYAGLKFNENTGKYTTFVRSDNIKVKFDIQSNIDPKVFFPKDKKWGLGVYGGVGLVNTFDRNFNMGASVGIGISYDLFSW